ncbi:methionine/alanine import family NSS transporter small subunit [Virgibacillus pantothenticus]|nr:methionine/alanine import family NSS transporter small subunit [Virgibacillus pantothenticus]
MTASAIFVMILGMVIIWGGLTASITYAVKKSRKK